MAYEHPGARAPDPLSCRYGASRLSFRGPRARLDAPYVAVLGGAESFGLHVAEPWPALLSRRIGQGVANLAAAHAGPDLWLQDPSLLAIAAGADLRVVQVTGAINLSNPYYTVHPRRNDRFVAASPALRRLYPDVDFTEFHFTRHLVFGLRRRDPVRFAEVASALTATWQNRMLALLDAIGAPTLLLLIGDPADAPPRLESRPPMVTAAMIAALQARCTGLVAATVPADPGDGMPLAGIGLPGAAAHAQVAATLARAIAAARTGTA